MNKNARKALEIVAAVVGTVLAALEPASATIAQGGFGFVPNAPVASSNGHLNAGTTWTDYPNGGVVNIPSTGNLGIGAGDAVLALTFPYLPGLQNGPVTPFDVTADGMTWRFTDVEMLVHQQNFVSAVWHGSFVGGGGFDVGTPADLSQSCDETIVIDCSNTTYVTSGVVSEPGTLALLLSGLGMLGFVRYRRRA